MAKTGSLFATIDALAGGERTLAPLDVEIPEWIDAVVPEELLTDPEAPAASLEFIEKWTPALLRDPHRRKVLPVVAGLGFAWLAVSRVAPGRGSAAARVGLLAATGVVGIGGNAAVVAKAEEEAESLRCGNQSTTRSGVLQRAWLRGNRRAPRSGAGRRGDLGTRCRRRGDPGDRLARAHEGGVATSSRCSRARRLRVRARTHAAARGRSTTATGC